MLDVGVCFSPVVLPLGFVFGQTRPKVYKNPGLWGLTWQFTTEDGCDDPVIR